jgi:hypothetical protein
MGAAAAAMIAVLVSQASAVGPNPRYGKWKLNVLSPDGHTIGVMYMRQDAEGKTTGVTFATYERME